MSSKRVSPTITPVYWVHGNALSICGNPQTYQPSLVTITNVVTLTVDGFQYTLNHYP